MDLSFTGLQLTVFLEYGKNREKLSWFTASLSSSLVLASDFRVPAVFFYNDHIQFFLQRNITFSESLTQVFEYPSSDSVNSDATADNTKPTKLGITSSQNISSFGEFSYKL